MSEPGNFSDPTGNSPGGYGSASPPSAGMSWKSQDQFDLLPDADLLHWVSVPYWTMDEGLALAVGKAPEQLTATWWPGLQTSPRFKRFERFRQIAKRAIEIGEISNRATPMVFCEWAERRLTNIDHLRTLVAEAGDRLTDWRRAFSILHDQFTNLSSEKLTIEAELARLTLSSELAEKGACGPENRVGEKPFGTRERENMLRALSAFAALHGFDPKRERTDATEKIRGALLPHVDLSAKTLRAWFKAGHDLNDRTG